MITVKRPSFHIIGISIKTSNKDGQAGQDIPALWGRFMGEGIAAKIPNKLSEEIYSIYTNYEGDHTQPYTTLLGCRVENLGEVPDGMTAMTFAEANYEAFVAKGNLMQGAVWQTWEKIWEADLDRTYAADFEVYGAKAQNPEDAEVDIFVSVK